jgi:uncharacterized caspase-like protein
MRIALALFSVSITLVTSQTFAHSRTGFVQEVDRNNSALLVSVGHGLPGLDIDIQIAETIANHASYKFGVAKLDEEESTRRNVEEALERMSADAGDRGTAFFYYTGHGSPNSLYLYDGSFPSDKIRGAIARGREGRGPLARLVMVIDACFSGSLLDPMRLVRLSLLEEQAAVVSLVDRLAESFSRGEKYWNSLMIIASSRADQTSQASPVGSIFTLAMKKAFDEVAEARGTVGMFFAKAREYTVRHEPVARFVPESLRDEKLVD